MTYTKDDKVVKIHIIGNYTSHNKGWAAMVLSSVDAIKNITPNVKFKFTIESFTPEADSKLYSEYGLGVTKSALTSPFKASFFLLKCYTWKFLKRMRMGNDKMVSNPEFMPYKDSDVILDLSGDGLCMPFTIMRVKFLILRNIISWVGHIYLFLYGMCFSKKIVLYARSLGPFGIFRPVLKIILNKSVLITIREDISYEYVKKLGIHAPIYLTADSSFVLSPAEENKVKTILINEGLKVPYDRLISKCIIGFSISIEGAKFYYPGGEDKLVEMVIRTIDYLIERYDTFVFLIPHSTGRRKFEDDRIISKKIYGLIKNNDSAFLIKGDYGPKELKGIIKLCDIFVGERMHATIAALSSFVPTLAIAHSHKYYGIMKMLGQEKWICNIQTLNYKELISKITNLLNNKERIKEDLKSRVEVCKKRSMLNARLFQKLVEEKLIVGK